MPLDADLVQAGVSFSQPGREQAGQGALSSMFPRWQGSPKINAG